MLNLHKTGNKNRWFMMNIYFEKLITKMLTYTTIKKIKKTQTHIKLMQNMKSFQIHIIALKY